MLGLESPFLAFADADMDLTFTQPIILLVAGAAAFGIAALLWALRISERDC